MMTQRNPINHITLFAGTISYFAYLLSAGRFRYFAISLFSLFKGWNSLNFPAKSEKGVSPKSQAQRFQGV